LKITSLRYYLFVPVMALLLAACGLADHSDDRTVITVGNRKVSSDEVKRDLKRMTFDMDIGAQDMQAVMEPFLSKLVDYYLILEYGREKGIHLSERELESAVREIKKDYSEKDFQETLLRGFIDFEDWKAALGEQLLIRKIVNRAMENMKPVSFEEIKTYYNSHQEEFRVPLMVRFRQIVTSTREEAEKALKRLNHGEDMGSIIDEFMKAQGKQYGGEVDWVAKGDLDESVEKVVFSLPVGKVSGVVQTPYGFHLFEVLERRPEGMKSLPEAVKEIELKLEREKQEAFMTQWLKGLRENIPVRINQKKLKELELG
jgi:parvulin-like peptidyl-prolyl isomerase